MTKILIIFIFLLIFIFYKTCNCKEPFDKMMEGRSKSGAILSVPALCNRRTVEYCETTKGCKWNYEKKKDNCELQKGWTTGSIGHTPVYVPRKCTDRNHFQCKTTQGCNWIGGPRVGNGCLVEKGYKEVKNKDGEIFYVHEKCSDRTINECGSGKNCIWIQGKCIRRDANQKHADLHASVTKCFIDHKGVGFGKDLFVCSEKPVPLKPSKMKSSIPDRPASEKKDIPILSQTLTCMREEDKCEREMPSSLLFGKISKKEFQNKKAEQYIRKLENAVHKIKNGFSMCVVKCGKKPPQCVDKEKGGGKCSIIKYNNKQTCENAYDGDTCEWKDNEWKKCTPDCRKWKCENCEQEKIIQKEKDKIERCVKNSIMKPPPFFRQKKEKPGIRKVLKTGGPYSTISPRVSEMNISMDLNADLIPYNEKKYSAVPSIIRETEIPGQEFSNCMYTTPTTGLFNETFFGAAKCALLGVNPAKCQKMDKCSWFYDEKDFKESRVGKTWKEQDEAFDALEEQEKKSNVNEAIKYLYQEDPEVAKEFVKTMRLPPDVEKDTFKMIEFLQTRKGKRWAEKRTGLTFDMWVLDYMVNFSSAQ